MLENVSEKYLVRIPPVVITVLKSPVIKVQLLLIQHFNKIGMTNKHSASTEEDSRPSVTIGKDTRYLCG